MEVVLTSSTVNLKNNKPQLQGYKMHGNKVQSHMADSDYKNFSKGKNCAICGSDKNVHTMTVVVNKEVKMSAVCTKPTCRGTARRNKCNSVSVISNDKVVDMPKNFVDNRTLAPKIQFVDRKSIPKQNTMQKAKPKNPKPNSNFTRKPSTVPVKQTNVQMSPIFK